MRNNKWLMMLVAAMAFLLITGCSSDKNDAEVETAEETPAEEENNTEETPAETEDEAETPADEEKTPATNSLESDEELKTQLEAETGIESVMVQVVDTEEKDAVNVDIEINDEQELSADEVIEKYSEVIKEKYPEHKIDVIVVQDGKMLKQTTLE